MGVAILCFYFEMYGYVSVRIYGFYLLDLMNDGVKLSHRLGNTLKTRARCTATALDL